MSYYELLARRLILRSGNSKGTLNLGGLIFLPMLEVFVANPAKQKNVIFVVINLVSIKNRR
jgi:hypothetical protein